MAKILLPKKIEKERRMIEIALPEEGGFDRLAEVASEQGFIYRGKPAMGQFLSEVATQIITQEPSTEE